MSLKFKKKPFQEADLDVTSFMNLMIVLVPVMLLSLTFTQITVHEIKLPDLMQSTESAEETPPRLEVLVEESGIKVFYPSNVMVKQIPVLDSEHGASHDFKQLSLVLQEVKKQLGEKRSILLLSDKSVNYQILVSAMDAVKSYKTVVAASLVEVELFPEISLADAGVKRHE